MSITDNRTTDIPSVFSIRVMLMMAMLTGVATISIIAIGGTFDGRHLVGFLLGLLATTTLLTQTLSRSYRRDIALVTMEQDRQEALRRQLANNTGTWHRLADGAEAYVAWMSHRAPHQFAIGGSLPAGLEPNHLSWKQARDVVRSLESSEWRPAADAPTEAIRRRLMIVDMFQATQVQGAVNDQTQVLPKTSGPER